MLEHAVSHTSCSASATQATLTDWAYQLYLVMDRSRPWPLVFYILYILLQCYFVVSAREGGGAAEFCWCRHRSSAEAGRS